MHSSALKYGKSFFDNYLSGHKPEELLIVDVGAFDVNGSLRQFSPKGASYIGVDFSEGRGVDIVLSNPYCLPFDSDAVDAIVCSSVFEHSEFFWILFLECLRVLKPTGLLYINVPSNGMVHRYPIDGWRFYPDAGVSLVNWAKHSGFNAILLESFIAPKLGAINGEGMWNDFVVVIGKNERDVQSYPNRIIDHEKNAFCGQAYKREIPWVAGGDSPDSKLLAEQAAKLAGISDELLDCKVALEATHKQIQELVASRSWRITAPLRWIFGQFKSGDGDAPSLDFKVDGSSSASFDVFSGLATSDSHIRYAKDCSKLIAFYLPQYHRIPENSHWWSPGFTEWTNVVKGRPNYDGHYQPHLPRELGFYDLSNVDVMREQAELARLYGIDAFCFYYYWFSGRRILDAPIDNFLNSDIEMDYCLCWANENWTRTWDGDSRSILMEQKYLESDPPEFIRSLLPHFSDNRYIKVDGKPMLVVYRAKDIPNVEKVFEVWRQITKDAGFPGLHIVAVDFYDITRPDEVGADALAEFPPHKFNGPATIPDKVPQFTNPDFGGGIVDYAKVMVQSANRPEPDFTLYRGILPSWDNTARRQNTPTILHGSAPEIFGEWLRYIRAYTRKKFQNRADPFIFVNAWNEWGEGCHLEPDQKWGLGYLEAVNSSAWFDAELDDLQAARQKILGIAADSILQREGGGGDSRVATERTLALLVPADGVIHKIAFVLRDYPTAHWLGRNVYHLYRSILRG